MYRILLVDDEPLVTESLKAKVDWTALNCQVAATATSAAEALCLVSAKRIDIVLTDIRMPGMDGLALTRRLAAEVPDVPVVIVSGHADFDYAREALKAGACGYCLKPFDPEEICGVLDKARSLRDGARQRAGLEGFSRLTSGDPAQRESAANLLRRLGWPPDDSGAYRLLALRAPRSIEPPATCDCHELDADAATRIYLVREPVPSLLEHWAVAVSSQGAAACLEPAQRRGETNPEGLRRRLLDMHGEAYRNFLGPSRTGVPHSPEEEGGLETFAVELIDCLRLNDTAKARETCRDIRGYLAKGGATMRALRSFLNTIDLFLAALDGAGEIAGSRDYAAMVRTYSGPETLMDDLERRVNAQTPRRLSSGLRQAGKANVAAMLDFVATNFQRPISTRDIAEHCGLNNSYVSALFSRETGQTLSGYITGLRVELAKKLLADSPCTLEEIAARAGFSDYFYFCRVFRKVVGCPPARYREQSRSNRIRKSLSAGNHPG